MAFSDIALIVVFAALMIVIITMFICFFKTFFAFRGKKKNKNAFPVPLAKAYEPYREQMVGWIKEVGEMQRKDFSLRSEDGLLLVGHYFEYSKDAPIELMFHGYRGSSVRDLSGGVHRAFELGHSALIVDHRASGDSEGRVITFGIKESRDARLWVDLIVREIDPDAKIILTGISMGAATVMTVASMELPPNVVGVLADCGYTSTREIIKKVIRDMKLPADLLYPFARLSARLFGGFDPEESSAIESMKKCTLPVIFFHGDADTFVPCEMSVENHAACASEKKRLVITEGAGHGLCYPKDPELYLSEMRAFFGETIEK